MNKKELMLPFFTGLSIFLFLVSFIPGISRAKKEKSTTFAIIDSKNANEITQIDLINSNGGVSIFKSNGVWKGKELLQNEQNFGFDFLADGEQVENLINKLKNNRKMYTFVYKDNNSEADFVNLDDSFLINIKDSVDLNTTLIIGKSDFSQNNRFIKINNQDQIKKIEWNDLEPFMHSEAAFWYDPYIIPRNLYSTNTPVSITRIVFNLPELKNTYTNFETDFSKLLELRHGALYKGTIKNLKNIGFIKIETEDLKEILLNFYQYSEDQVVLDYNLSPDSNYKVFLSSWTFEKLQQK